MSKKLIGILEGAATIVLGVLVAIFGGQAVLDLYFGILFIIASAGLLAFAIVILTKTRILNFFSLFGAFAFALFGSFLLANYYSFGYFMYTLVLLIIAAGFALIPYGVYTIVKFSLFYGIGQIVVGAGVATLGLCYLFIPEFYQAFWIVAGCLIALYGLFMLLSALFTKEEKPAETQEQE